MECFFDWFTLRRHADHVSERFDGLFLRRCGEREERLILMPPLTDDRIDIFVGQIHFVLFNACFLCILPDGSANIDQTAAQRLCAFTVLPLMRFVNDDGKSPPAEFLHILFGKEKFLNGADNDTFLIIDGFRETAGVLFIVDCFDQSDLMLKAVNGVL